MTTTAGPSSKAWIITGPTSGIGRRTALQLAEHGTVVLVGRDPAKLAAVEAVNSAGVAHYMPLAELAADQARELVHVKVLAPTMLTRAAVGGTCRAPRGRSSMWPA